MKKVPSSEPASPSSAIKRSSSAPLLGGNPNKATPDEEAAQADKAAVGVESAPTPAKSWYEWFTGSVPAPSSPAPVIGVPVADAQAPVTAPSGGDEPRFKLNERVECRDDGKKWWAGTVVSVDPLLVQPTGAAWTKGFTWDEVRIPIQGGAPTSPSLTSSTAAKDAPAVAEKVAAEPAKAAAAAAKKAAAAGEAAAGKAAAAGEAATAEGKNVVQSLFAVSYTHLTLPTKRIV